MLVRSVLAEARRVRPSVPSLLPSRSCVALAGSRALTARAPPVPLPSRAPVPRAQSRRSLAAMTAWTPPGPTDVPAPKRPAINDRHTLSNIADVYSTKLHLDWTIDWDAKRIEGSVEHSLRADKDVSEVVLDTSYLDIKSVNVDGQAVDGYKKEERQGMLGEALRIPLAKPLKAGETATLKIEYATTDSCTALGWLTKEQTAGKTAPFLYSQCQAIHARSMLPCMDSPSRKVTYTSRVRSRIPVLMSALPTHADPTAYKSSDAMTEVKEYTFEQKIGIPTYLIAIVGGALDFRPLGPRTGIYAEGPVIEKAKWEFEKDAEHFLEAAEKIVSPYSWTRYDSVVLPPSFPYGGMENANMTTLTPALVCGDRSLTDVLAHELMHSWSGNLTSCANWSSFWLNEGWTVYLERLVLQEVHGGAKSKGGPAARGFSYIIGAKALKDALEQFSGEPRFQRLVPVFHGVEDPDDAFSSVPYEKGSNFLLHIENTIGGLDVFMPYVKSYFATFFDRSVTTEEWREHLYAFYAGNPEVTKKLDSIQWDKWLHGEGVDLPVDMTKEYNSTLAEAAFALAQRWEAVITGKASASDFGPADVKGWNSNQVVVFLEKLHSGPQVPLAVVKQLDQAYSFSKATNGEVLLRFFEVALEVKSDDGVYAQQAAEWVKGQGRMKFCRTIYRALYKIEPELARSTFKANQSFYHPIAANLIQKDLRINTTELEASEKAHAKDIVAVIGSTGTGKSQLAVELAQTVARLHSKGQGNPYASAEVISADSMQVYRTLDVITNKVTPEEMQDVKHHLIDFLEPGQEYRVESFNADARRIAADLRQRQPAPSLPIVAGGTTYYVQHLLFPGRLVSAEAEDPSEDLATRSRRSVPLPDDVVLAVEDMSPEEHDVWLGALGADDPGSTFDATKLQDSGILWRILNKVDPVMAKRWHYKDTRKVLRSVRVLQTTGKRHSDWIKEQDRAEDEATSNAASGESPDPSWRLLLFWVWRDPASLNKLLNGRIRKMIERGLLDEIRQLRAMAGQGPGDATTDYTRGIFQAIGYKEFDAYLSHQEKATDGFDDAYKALGDKLFEQGITDMEIATRQYAKKQVAWIRNKLAPEIRRVRAQAARAGKSPYVDVYLLDATEDWQDQVSRPANDILEAWLRHEPLPEPTTLSKAAGERLGPLLEAPSTAELPGSTGSTLGKNELKRCDICSVVPDWSGKVEEVWIRLAEWDQHFRAKSHRRAVRIQNQAETIARAKAEGQGRKAARQERRATEPQQASEPSS